MIISGATIQKTLNYPYNTSTPTMAYILLTRSYGSVNARGQVRIFETTTGVPAVLLATSTGGLISDKGVTYLDNSGNLSVYVDGSKTLSVICVDQNVETKYPVEWNSVTGEVQVNGNTLIPPSSPGSQVLASIVNQAVVADSPVMIATGGVLGRPLSISPAAGQTMTLEVSTDNGASWGAPEVVTAFTEFKTEQADTTIRVSGTGTFTLI